MNELNEDEKLLCRKKWLSSFERYGDKISFPLRGSHSKSLAPSGQSKTELNKKKKAETHNFTSANKDSNMTAVNNNPKIRHSIEGNKKFKDKTGKKHHKEKLMVSHLCNNEIQARQNDGLGESCPNSKEKQDVHSNSFQSRDTSAINQQPTSSGSLKKKKKKKIRKPDIEGYNSKCDSRRAPVEQTTKKDAKSPGQCAQFGYMKKVSPLKLEKVTSIGSQKKGCKKAGNKLTKNGAKTDSCRDSCHGIIEKAGLLNLNGNSSNENFYKLFTSSNKNKDNQNNNDHNYSENSSCTKRLKLDKSNATNSKNTISSNISTINKISKATKIHKASKTREKIGVKKKKNGGDRKGKKQAKTSSIRNKSKKMTKSDLLSTCEPKNRGLLSKVEPALSLDVDNESTETKETLKTSGCLKDSTVFKGQPDVLPTNNNQYIGLDKDNAYPKLEQSDVDWKSESIEDIVARARSLIIKCRRNSLLFKYSTCKSDPQANIKSRPLKKNILMRASMRDNLDVAEEKLALSYNSPNLHTPLKQEESSWDRFMINSNARLSNSTPPQQGKQDCVRDQMYSTIDDDMDTSCERSNSMPPATLVETPSLLSLASVEERSSRRHPKKTLLEKFRRDTNESIRTEKVSNEDQVIYHPTVKQEKHISNAEQVNLNAGISGGKVGLATKETGNENIPPQTASTLIHESMCTANADEGAWERRSETSRDSRTFRFPGQEKPMKNMYPCLHQCINAGYPFAFSSVDCFYNSNCHRVGYIHRRFPAISVPCIIIGDVQFVTIRAALKLFSRFNENCFIQHFLRTARNKWICSEYQVSCLKKLSNLPELDLMEGDVLVQVSPLLHNFHCFQHAKRRLFSDNHETVNAPNCHEHQCSTPKQ